MTGFKLWTSGIGSDCSTNWATTTAHYFFLFLSSVSLLLSVPSLPTYSTYLPILPTYLPSYSTYLPILPTYLFYLPTYSTYLAILPTYLPSLLTFVSAYCQNRPLITSYFHYRLFKMCCNKIIDDRKSLMTVLFEGLLNNWQNLKTIMVKVQAIGPTFIVVNGQILKNWIAMWSHCPTALSFEMFVATLDQLTSFRSILCVTLLSRYASFKLLLNLFCFACHMQIIIW